MLFRIIKNINLFDMYFLIITVIALFPLKYATRLLIKCLFTRSAKLISYVASSSASAAGSLRYEIGSAWYNILLIKYAGKVAKCIP